MPPATTPDVGLAVASTPAASSPPPMVAFCASHVSSLRRLKALKEMVASWAGQAHGIPLHVSVSSVVDVAPVTHRAIERLLAEHGGLRVTYTGAVVRSQFEHFRALATSLRTTTKDAWVIFSDDDDVWHPQRTLHYLAGINNGLASNCPQRIISVKVLGTVTGELEQGTSDAVELALDRGDMQAMDGTEDELWMYACRMSSLLDFVDRAASSLLESRYCDMYLLQYLRYSEGYDRVIVPLKFPAARWSYAYRDVPRLERLTSRAEDDEAFTNDDVVGNLQLILSRMQGRQPSKDDLRTVATTHGILHSPQEGAQHGNTGESWVLQKRATEALLDAWLDMLRAGKMSAFTGCPMPPDRAERLGV